MPTGGATTFIDSDDYRASVAGARVDLVFTHPGDFNARLTWVKLPNLRLFSAKENLPRIAYVSLAPEFAFIGFPTQFDPPPVWKGVELQRGDIVFHSRGAHASADERPKPVVVDVAAAAASCGIWKNSRGTESRAARSRPRAATPHAHGGAPPASARKGLSRRRNETWHHTAARGRPRHGARSAPCVGQLPDGRRGSRAPGRKAISHCAEFLGMSPSRYLLLRRLNMVWAALRHSSPATATVAEHARRHGFTELGHFAGSYRAVFGETPSTTLRGSLDRSP
jgi:hypothetical protein